MTKILPAFLLAAAIATTISASQAATITDVELYGEYVQFGQDSFATANGFAGQSGLAGEILLTTDNGNTIDAWCIDLFHDVYLGGGQDLTYTGVTLSGASNGDGGALTSMQAQEIGGLIEYGNRTIAGGATVDQAAGIQMAIWATEYAGLTFTGPTAALAAEQADLLLAPTLFGNTEAFVSATGTQQLSGDTQQIPEPAALALMGVGLLGLAMFRRSRVATIHS